MSAPASHEGWLICDLVMNMTGHLKYAGMAGTVVGIEAVSLLAVAEAKGLPRGLVVEFLPWIEAAVMAGIKKMRDQNGG